MCVCRLYFQIVLWSNFWIHLWMHDLSTLVTLYLTMALKTLDPAYFQVIYNLESGKHARLLVWIRTANSR